MAEPTIQDYQNAIAAQSGPTIQDYQNAIAAQTPKDAPSGGWLSRAANAIDSVTGAPTRAAISAAQDGNNPFAAFGKQFGNTTDQAPTGKDIVMKAGLSDDDSGRQVYMNNPQGGTPIKQPLSGRSDADMGGFLMDQAANPLNFAGPGLKAIGKGAEVLTPFAEGLQDTAAERAIKAAGAMKKDFNMIQDKGMQSSLGSFLLDNKYVTPLSTVSKVADRLSEAKQTAGEAVGHILDTTDAAANAPKISASDIALKLSEDPDIMNLSAVPGKEGTASQINKYLQTLYNNGDSLSLREAQKLRQGIDSSINFNKRVPEMAGAQPYLYKMRDALANAMNDSVNSLSPGDVADKLKTANSNYSKLATLEKIAQNRVGALASNEKIGLGDKIMAGVGGVIGHGNPIAAVAGGAISKTSRAVGNSLAATGANTASKILSSAPEALQNIPAAAGPISNAVDTGLRPSVLSMPNAAQNPTPQGAPMPIVPQSQPMPVQNQIPQGPVKPVDPKGPDKWAGDGLQNLKGHVNDDDRKMLEDNKGAMLVDPKTKQLLITASNFPPGSKPLDDIVKHIKNRLGKK